MRGAELSHHNGNCSFETFLERYELDDVVLWDIARVVHEADLGDERYDAPEARGLDVLIRGLSLTHEDDDLLALSYPLFDGPLRIPQTRLDARPRTRLSTSCEVR